MDDTVYTALSAPDWQPPSGQPASFRVCGTPVPSATCQAACDGVGGYGQVTHSDGIMYDCYEAPAAATDGPFASSVEGGWGLLWVFPATLAELATDAGSNSTLLGSLGIRTNLSEPVRPSGRAVASLSTARNRPCSTGVGLIWRRQQRSGHRPLLVCRKRGRCAPREGPRCPSRSRRSQRMDDRTPATNMRLSCTALGNWALPR